MGLQLRIRHAFKARIVEIPRREGTKPVRVGRDESCEVPIPVEQVGPVHCLLYIHGDQWVVAPAGPVLSLNGVEITEPQFIDSGDKISLGMGPSAPMIEVDPNGLARQQAAAAVATEASVAEETPANGEFAALEAACGGDETPIYVSPAPPRAPKKPDVRLVAGVIGAAVVVLILLIWMVAGSGSTWAGATVKRRR